MTKRTMPPKGFYVWDHHQNPMNDCLGRLCRRIIFTTGIRGGGGHKYWRSENSKGPIPSLDINDWATLTWSCVPGKDRIDKYRYFEDLNEALVFYNS